MALAGLLPSVLIQSAPARAQSTSLYDRPVLIVDPGMHTAPIKSIAVDRADRFAVTGSDDKTVRVWSISNGELLRTIRIPAGPGATGKIYAVAIDPAGDLIAAGGLTLGGGEQPIYLFDRATGLMRKRIGGLRQTTNELAFSADGRYLAAAHGGKRGLCVYDRDSAWTEAFCDPDYGEGTYGLTFAQDGRLATASPDGSIRLYDRDFRLVVRSKKLVSGNEPFRVAFNPDGSKLALGYVDVPVVDLFDGHTLERLTAPSNDGLRDGGLNNVV